MSEAVILKIDLAKVGEVRKGADGRAWLNLDRCFAGKNGAQYLDCVLWERRDGEDAYGNTHSLQLSLSREERESGKKGTYIGNGRPMKTKAKPAPKETRPAAAAPANSSDDDSVPF